MHRLVPHFILDKYQSKNFHGSFSAVALLVDVSGFSNMTDALAQHGVHGSEVLANGMRQVFDPMIQSVLEYGGYLVGFAGDAITALFPANPSGEDAYTQAIAAALSIQKHRSENAAFKTSYGEFNISVKIGLGAGGASWRIVLSKGGKRATYYFHGTAIEEAIASLSLSGSGQIILSRDLHRSLAGKVSGVQKEAGFLLRDFSGDLPEPRIINLPSPEPDHLKVFCSDEVSSHDLAGEFRPAVNLFIGLPAAIDHEKELESFIQRVFSLQNTYGGLFSRVDIGDKGANLLMFWGAPIAQENDVERALNFFLQLRKETGIPIIAGITYRLAYAGYMGGALQEEYTCYGWGVSLSARLMTAAEPGEIWADEEIARRAGQRFNFQYVGKQKFKGFAHKQNVFKLVKRKEDDRVVFSGEFVGREAELETLSRFIRPVWSGQFAGLLTIVGEPGIGKSRLIDAFQASSIFTEKESYWAVCQSDEIVRQSLNPFRYWLKRYFNILEFMDETESKQAFDEKMAGLIASLPESQISQELNRTRSFLGELVNLHWPESPYESMDAQGRFDNTFIALSSLIRVESLRQPLIILIEDVHLLDNDTKSFLSYLERTLTAVPGKSYPVALLATSRYGGSVAALEHALSSEISLSAVTKENLVRLAENLLAGVASPSLLRILEKRAEGNPFFIEQIIHYLREDGRLEQGRQGWQINEEEATESLPTDINVILIARLDRLNREVRDVVQTAAVLGREFELRLLSQMLQNDNALPRKVHVAVEEDILSILTEIRYIFRHTLLRVAAYNMQLEARKQELHRIAVEAFETLYAGQLSPHYFEIAYHADRAGLGEKAKKFYILSGEDAARAYKNSVAIESYTRALALGSIEDIQERIDLLLARVALYRIVGDRAGQEQDLATLELLADQQRNNRNRAIVALRQLEFAFDMGDFPEAQRLAESCIEIAGTAKAQDVVALVYRTLPLAAARQGKIEEALTLANAGLQLTQQLNDKDSEGQIFNQLGLITLETGEFGPARALFEKSLAIAQETGNRRLEAQVLNNMGMIRGMFDNDYVAASEYYEKTLEITQEIGNRLGACHALGNLGWSAAMLGDFEQAHTFFLERLRVARESGSGYLEVYGRINLGAMKISQELYSDAREHTEQALNLAQKLGDRSTEAWALTYLGHAHLGLGNFMDATDRFQTALNIRHSLNQKTLAMEPLAGLVEVELARDEPDAALGYVKEILTHLTEGGNLEGTDEPLRVYLTVYLALKSNRDMRADQILEDAHSLLSEQVGKVQEQTQKVMFLQNVPWRRKIQGLWQQRRASKKRNI